MEIGALARELLEIERELAAGDGGVYDRHLADGAIVIVPGQTLDKAATVTAMDASPGWEEFSIEGERVLPVGDGTALLTYRFHGRRGASEYEAVLSSAYVREGDDWKLAFHQQTPVE
jgi:Domain of unknown function (DUF4440)